MIPSGLFQVVADRRERRAPRPALHQFRHSFADAWLAAGGNEAP